MDDGGWTPLLSASSAGNEEVVDYLISAKADVNYMEEQVELTMLGPPSPSSIHSSPCLQAQLSALHAASSKGHAGIIRALLRAGASIECTDRSALPSHDAVLLSWPAPSHSAGSRAYADTRLARRAPR